MSQSGHHWPKAPKTVVEDQAAQQTPAFQLVAIAFLVAQSDCLARA